MELDGLTQGMKPAFALSLSSEGIALFHRAADGWRDVGRTAFDNEDLPKALAALRADALRLEPDSLYCKLILPRDQIRYLTVETGEVDEDARLAAARLALEGATPYAVEELAFDISADGPRTHVAAVALETLDEAETFAVEHDFGPVSFVSQPSKAQGDGFRGEPFFGTTRAIRGTEVTPDTAPVTVVGPAHLPASASAAPKDEPTQAPPATPHVPSSAATETAAAKAATAEDAPAAQLDEEDTALELEVSPALDLEPELDLEPALKAAEDPAAVDPQEGSEDGPKTGGAPAETKRPQPAAEKAADEQHPAEADKTTETTAATAAAETATAAAADKGRPPEAADPDKKEPTEKKVGKATEHQVAPASTAAEDKPAPVVPPAPPVKPVALGADTPDPQTAFASRRARADAPAPKSAPATAVPVPPPGAVKPLMAKPEESGENQDGAKAAKAAAAAPIIAPAKKVPAAPAATLPPAPAAPSSAAKTAAQPVAATSHSQPDKARGKPKFLGVILTAFLLLFMATVAVWAVYGSGDFWSDQPAPDSPDAPAASPDGAEAPDDNGNAGSTPLPDGQSGEEVPAIAPQVSVLPDQPDPGVREIIPQPPETTAAPLGAHAHEPLPAETASTELLETDAVDPSPEDEAAADGVDLPEEGTESAFVDTATLTPEQDQPEQDPAAPGPDAVSEAETAGLTETADSTSLDPLAAAARYAATGVWPTSPAMEDAPQAVALDQLYTASIDQIDLAADAVALPQAGSFEADLEPAAVASPAAAGRAYELDARGLVKATPEGTLNPDGVMVYLGRPQKVPPAAPDRSDPDAEALAEAVARNQLLSQLRPKSRPEDLAERIERSQLGGFSREELARVRPKPRPPSLKPANENQLPVTAQAVGTSVVPRSRPSNFANLVDRARRNSQNDASRTAAAVPASAAAAPPRIPTTASVARRATVSGAINLRKINLIGVYGTASNRSALIRLPSGRYKKVQVGDRIDGGRIIAIGDGQLQYQKGGRNRTLTMPKG